MGNAVRKKKPNKRLVSLSVLAIVFVFGIYFCVTFIKQEVNIFGLHAEATEVQNQIDEQAEYSKELKENMKEENKTRKVEEKARELGYLKNDEILFVDSSEK